VAYEEPNYLAHAFKSQYNLIGLGTALGFTLLSGSADPLILAAGIELVLLPLVAWSPRFQRLVRARISEDAREEGQAKKRKETSEILKALPNEEFQRYRALEILAGEIRGNYKGLDASSRILLDELIQKLEFLLSFYLRMRYSVTRYEAYFATTSQRQLEQRIAQLDKEISVEKERIREIKIRTRAVLEKRLERFNKALENKQLVNAQTETVQEVLQLLRDQSYAMRDPRTVTEQLDTLVSSAEETERGVRDMEQLLDSEHDLLAPDSLSADVESELKALSQEEERPALGLPSRPITTSPPPPPRKKVSH